MAENNLTATRPRRTVTMGPYLTLLAGFFAVHAWLTVLGTRLRPGTFFDLELYRYWVANGFAFHGWPVLDFPWVYPVGALVPMVVASAQGDTLTTSYELAWCALVTALDALAVLVLIRHRRVRGAWWWLGFQTLLGLIAIGRIDAIIAPMMVIALSFARERPRLCAVLLTAGAWIKIAPGALLIALAASVRRPLRSVIVPAAVTCAVVIEAVVIGGGAKNLLSFLTVQGNRGLQVESVAATPWVLAASVRHDIAITYNTNIFTYEVTGPGVAQVNAALNGLLVVALAALGVLIWRVRRRGSHALLAGAMATLTLLIVLNKVGSPQFICWLAAPVAVALSRDTRESAPRPRRERWHSWPVLAGLLLVIAALTQRIYPFGYGGLISGQDGIPFVFAARNLLLVGVLTLAVVAVVRAGVDPPEADDAAVDRAAAEEAFSHRAAG